MQIVVLSGLSLKEASISVKMADKQSAIERKKPSTDQCRDHEIAVKLTSVLR